MGELFREKGHIPDNRRRAWDRRSKLQRLMVERKIEVQTTIEKIASPLIDLGSPIRLHTKQPKLK